MNNETVLEAITTLEWTLELMRTDLEENQPIKGDMTAAFHLLTQLVPTLVDRYNANLCQKI